MQLLSVPVLLLIGFSPFFLLAAIAEFMRQILRGMFEPTYAAFSMSRVTTKYRGTLSGFYNVTWSVGYSIGPMIAGALQRYVSLSAAFVMGGVLLSLSAILLRVFFGSGSKVATP